MSRRRPRHVSHYGFATEPTCAAANASAMANLVLAAIVALGAALRGFRLAGWPDAMNQDEVVLGYNAWALGRSGHDLYGHPWPLLLQSFGDWTTPLSTYLTIPFVVAGGLSAFTTRLPAVIENTLLIVAVYELARRLFASRAAGMAAALATALAPWDVQLAQWAAEPSPVPLLTACALLAGLAARNGGPAMRVGFGVLCGVLVYAYTPEKLYGPLLALAGMLALPLRAGPWIALGALVALPMEFVSFVDPQAASRFHEVGLDLSDPAVLPAILQRYAEYLTPDFLFAHGDAPFPTVLAPFLYLGFAWLVAAAIRPGTGGVNRRAALFVLLALALAPVPASLTADHEHVPRMTHALPLVLALIGGGLGGVWTVLRAPVLRGAGAAAFALLLGWQSAQYYQGYFDNAHLRRMHGRQYALGAALVATAHAARGRTVLVDTTIGRGWNQPFAYYLFFLRRDPRTLPLEQMRASQRGIPWSYVTAIDNVRFGPIPDRAAVEAAPPVDVLPPAIPYAVHAAGETWVLYEPVYLPPI